MRLRRNLLAILTLLMSLTIQAAQKSDAAKVMFEAAKKKELVDGDLNGAIQQYKAIAAKFKDDHATAAAALLRLADCYQSLGDTQSREVYRQILRDYADQKDAAAMARARLGKESRTSDSPVSFRQIWKGDADGMPSPDGRYLPYVDWGQHGDLFVHDFSTDTNRRVTDAATDGLRDATIDQFALSASFSRDSKHLAYSWFRSDNNHTELRLIDLGSNGIPPSRLLFDSPDVEDITFGDWSPDGKFIAVGIGRTDKSGQIALVSVLDGALRVLKSVDWRGPTTVAFSPDGKYLAYDVPANDSTDQRDIFVIAMDGSREIPVIAGPSQDTVVGWSHDGKRLLFASDRSGSEALWSIPVMAGKANNSPDLVRRDIGQFSRLGFVNGRLYGIVHSPNAGGSKGGDIYTATADFGSGKLQSPPSLAVQTYVGNNTFPDWSPDGKYLAYASRRGAAGPQHFVIAIRFLETGEVRELTPSPGLDLVWSLAWASDGSALLAVGKDTKGRYGIFKVDSRTGRNSLLATKEEQEKIPVVAGVSLDGEKLYYVRVSASPAGFADNIALVEKDLTSGREKELLRTATAAAIRLSPDGRYLAIVGADASKPGALSILPTAGGDLREVATGARGLIEWAADSRAVYSFKGAGELWRFPIDESGPRKVLDFKLEDNPQIAAFHLHPDGRRIAFQKRVASSPAELWLLENLPEVNASK